MAGHVAKPYWIVLASMLSVAPLSAQGQTLENQKVRLPGSGYEIVLAPAASPRDSALPDPLLVRAISDWLSFGFGLPAAAEPPGFRFAPLEAMIAVRDGGVSSDNRSDATIGGAGLAERPDIVALYDAEARIIYLRTDWTGDTAAELSVLVHELVHHLQNIAGLKFACDEMREEMAFAAQERWLGLFGTDLATEFGLDPFTLLVRTNCPM